MSERGAQARALFEQGYNCAQSVAGAFADVCGVSQPTMMRLISPFGGGMGRLREVCGTFSGMLAVLGLLYGYNDPQAFEEKRVLYTEVQALAAQFRERNGALICHELLGLRAGPSDPTPAQRTPEYYRTRRCGDLVEGAAELMEQYIAAHPR